MHDPFLYPSLGGLLVLISLVVAFAPVSDTSKERRANAAAQSVGLALKSAIEPVVVRRLLRAARLSRIGSALGWAVGFGGVAAVFNTGGYHSWATWLAYGSFIVGAALGNAVAALIDGSGHATADRPRLARTTAVTIDDYVPRSEIVLARAAIVGMLLVVGAVVAAGLLPPVAAAGIDGLAAVSLGVLEVGGRSIVAQHQLAASTTELAWDDALRSKNLQALALAPLMAALYGVMASLFALLEIRGPLQSVVPCAIGAVAVAIVVIVIVMGSRRGDRDRYYLRRLWPATAAAGEQSDQADQALRATA